METPKHLDSKFITFPLVSASARLVLLRSAVAFFKMLSNAQSIGIVLAAVLYIIAGAFHFIKPDLYLRIMPPYVPWHAALVRLSGFFEILGGLGLLIPQTRRAAAWGLVALLIAVLPANVYMATNPVEAGTVSLAPVLRWGRLPVQVLLIWWLLWCTRPRLTFR